MNDWVSAIRTIAAVVALKLRIWVDIMEEEETNSTEAEASELGLGLEIESAF
jgi:hypothetical protein